MISREQVSFRGFPQFKLRPGKIPWCQPKISGRIQSRPARSPLRPAHPHGYPPSSHRVLQKMVQLILASSSPIRLNLLKSAGLRVESVPPNVDEETIRESLLSDVVQPRDIADTLAEHKARRVAGKFPGRLVLGSDQILTLNGRVFAKPSSRAEAADQLDLLQSRTHLLHSAAVMYEDSEPTWRTVSTVRLTMHPMEKAEIEDYLDHVWPAVSYCVGAYQAESYGARLFSRIDGDWFSVLGLPLLEILSHFRQRGMLKS